MMVKEEHFEVSLVCFLQVNIGNFNYNHSLLSYEP